jgi:hypothetical protein
MANVLSMAYVEGENLAPARQIGRFTSDKARLTARQICVGLARSTSRASSIAI